MLSHPKVWLSNRFQGVDGSDDFRAFSPEPHVAAPQDPSSCPSTNPYTLVPHPCPFTPVPHPCPFTLVPRSVPHTTLFTPFPSHLSLHTCPFTPVPHTCLSHHSLYTCLSHQYITPVPSQLSLHICPLTPVLTLVRFMPPCLSQAPLPSPVPPALFCTASSARTVFLSM